MLFPDKQGWQAVSDYVREDLYQQYKVGSREGQIGAADIEWIHQKTEPEADNFKYFQPVVSEDGLARALRFIFPPYQVWVLQLANGKWRPPASIFYPHLAEEYRYLFVVP